MIAANPSPAQAGSRGSALRLIDPASIAVMIAALYFAGWSYYRAYLLRLGLEPAGMGLANLAIGAEGAGAILTTTGMWLWAILPLLFVVLLIVLLDAWRYRKGKGTGWLGADSGTVSLIRAGLLAVAMMIILGSGDIAGRRKAHDQLSLVKDDGGWDFHLPTGALRGVPIAQANDRIWLLTKGGVRPVRIDDIRNIDGPLFEKVAGGE
jgi:hypothetical protein